ISVTAYIANIGEANATADIIFYCNDQWLGTTKAVVLGKNSSTATTTFTAPNERTVIIKVKISDCIPAETNIANNELTKTLSIYLPEVFDKVIYEGTTEIFERNYTHTGHIVVRGMLIISNSTFSLLTTDYEWHIAILGNGKLVIRNATLTSNYKLKIYLYDNSSLEAYNSTLDANILGEGNVELTLEMCKFNGSFNISCCSLLINQTSISGDFGVTAKNIVMRSANITGTNNVVSDIFLSENSTFAKSLALCGTATLINVTGSITSKAGGVILRYWLAKIEVSDIAGSGLENASVKISRDGIVEVDKATDKDGKLVAVLLAHNITSYGAKFLGNYELIAEYKTPTRNYTAETGFQLTSNLLLEIVFPYIIILPQSLEIDLAVEPSNITAGEYFTVSGKILYNIGDKPPVKNANLTISINGIKESATTDEEGRYTCKLKAPEKENVYTVKVTITDPIYSILGESSASITVLAPPTPPTAINIVPIVVAVVVVVIVIVVCFILRRKLKACLAILKAKLKREEFTECTECGKKIPSSWAKCLFCGAEFEEKVEELAKCSECGAFIPITAKKCPKCGALFKE
ncbi:MAG: zinc ribbon domain-containing protein, partial [Candidatus Thermoplasmatota archaeon]